ncbi:hypothetical protein EYF80_056836 [Liparis tanakae]|uniref:Uncharacterized protein n=1 Tax=Liparis tanakae TaxID=230148 RepID=A0A4Z2EWQ1_9TELE|nr:hypothetical protein EYF80_056836 [Liparis tanakae]
MWAQTVCMYRTKFFRGLPPLVMNTLLLLEPRRFLTSSHLSSQENSWKVRKIWAPPKSRLVLCSSIYNPQREP